MSWTSLTTTADWTTFTSGYPAARVRPLTTPANTAQLEGYLLYSGTASVGANVDINTTALPSGAYDTGANHTIGGRWYNSNGAHVGTAEIFINSTGGVAAIALPAGAYALYFGDVYPTA